MTDGTTHTPSRRRREAPEDPIAVALDLERRKVENAPSKRLLLAAMITQGLVGSGSNDVYRIAHQAFAMADALIEVENY
jgi:hypothetical protein